MKRKLYTLAFVKRKSEILLGFKKRGYGQGKWNGFGGKVEAQEDIETAAKRELLEESNLIANNLIKVGILDFESVGEPVVMEVHVFLITDFSGEPKESDEMRPNWFTLDCIPYDEMWADNILWIPVMLKGAKFQGYYKFRGHDTIIENKLEEVTSLS